MRSVTNRKALLFFALFILLAGVFCIKTYAAQEAGALPDEYYSMLEELPEDISDDLPDKLYSKDAEEVSAGLEEMISFEYFFRTLGELLSCGTRGALSLLATLCGICIFSALMGALSSGYAGSSLSRALGLCSSCALFAAVAELFLRQIEAVGSFFSRLSTLMLSVIPVSCTVLAMGGELKTAALGGSALYVFLAFAEQICARSVFPVCFICMAIAIASGLSPGINIGSLGSAIKKCYIFVLTMIMTVLLALLSAQTLLASAADTTAAKAIKVVASSVIPIVGGSISETLRTVAASTQYIKSVAGIGAVVLILMLVLPTLIELLLARLAFTLSASFAEILGCEREKKLIGEIGGVMSCMIAAVAISGVAFIFAMNIFIKTTVALG